MHGRSLLSANSNGYFRSLLRFFSKADKKDEKVSRNPVKAAQMEKVKQFKASGGVKTKQNTESIQLKKEKDEMVEFIYEIEACKRFFFIS